MPASSGLGTLPADTARARAARQAAADTFFARQRTAREYVLLKAEREINNSVAGLRDPDLWHSQHLAQPFRDPTPQNLLDAWACDCERARIGHATQMAAVKAHLDAERRAEAIAIRRERAREYSRARRSRVAAQDARRVKNAERVRTWQDEHPDRVRETKRRWEKNHAERRRQASRDYYQRNKDAILARQKERHLADPSVRQKRQEAYRREHPDRVAASNKAWRSKLGNEQRHKDATNRWKRRERRRRELGLPPFRLHRRDPEQMRADADAADEFFHRHWSKREIRRAARRQPQPAPPAALTAMRKESASAKPRDLATDPAQAEREAHQRDLWRAQEERRAEAAARDARMDAIARAINDRLRIAGPRRRPAVADPAAPFRPPPSSSRGMGR